MRETHQTDVLVIGGGVIGLACAYYLNKSGRQVHVIEQKTIGASQNAAASYGNCGLLFFSDLPPLCQPGTVRDELGRMLKRTSPLYIKLDFDLARLLWLLKFAAKCHRAHMIYAMHAREALLSLSKSLYEKLLDQERLPCNWQKRGVLLVYKNQERMRQYESVNTLLQHYDAAAKFVARADLLKMEPSLREDVCGAWHHEIDSHLQPEQLWNALKKVVTQQGVKITENCAFTGFETAAGSIASAATAQGRLTADHYVLAAGAWSPQLVKQLVLRLPVQPGKGYSITIDRPEFSPRIPCYFWERAVVATPLQDGLRLGGTMEFSGFNQRIDAARIQNLKQAAKEYLLLPPGKFAGQEWVGLRPMCYDDLPIIGPAPRYPNLFLATGHGMIGVTAATGTAQLVTCMITDQKPPIDPAPFGLQRFG